MCKRKRRPSRRKPELTVAMIRQWVAEHRERTGEFPFSTSGLVRSMLAETWSRVDGALRRGNRGLPGGSSLGQLIEKYFGVPCKTKRLWQCHFSEEQILAWADDHHRRTGKWPAKTSGRVSKSAEETWALVDEALRRGSHGLRGGSSLAQLLHERRGARNIGDLPALSERQIVTWADAHHARTGAWPSKSSGPVREAPGETWANVDAALNQGGQGLERGGSILRLLAEHRGVRNPKRLPPLTERQVLAWADAHRARTGAWPLPNSGPIVGTRQETWKAIDWALRRGRRRLRGGTTLSLLLAKRRAVRNVKRPPKLSHSSVLAWAEAHRKRTAKWPTAESGPIPQAAGESWRAVDAALRHGARGFPGGSSLARLLAASRGVRNRGNLPRLTIQQVLAWADRHHRRHGSWPALHSGAVLGAPSETWRNINGSLRAGTRGLPGGSSLALLLARRRGARNKRGLRPLSEEQILVCAEAHHKRTGKWPTHRSGPIRGAPRETWGAVASALYQKLRGLPRRTTLSQLLAARRGIHRRHGSRG